MKAIVFSVLLLSVFGGSAYAQETQVLYSQHGKATTYKITYNNNGAVLRSSKDVIYLGKNCDAKSSKYGNGKWWWANGGWGIGFNSGQELNSAAQAESPNIQNNYSCSN